MKTFCTYLLLLPLIIALNSCEDDDKIKGPIPFRFEFTSFGGPVAGDTSCGDAPIVLVRQEGEGEDILLGKFTFVAQFCNNLETGAYFDGPNVFGYFEAENGDQLNIVGPGGQVIPSTKEGYDLMFQDPINFEDGTGRFEGATGTGMTDSFVILAEGRTDHVWSGTLILK